VLRLEYLVAMMVFLRDCRLQRKICAVVNLVCFFSSPEVDYIV